MNKADGQCFNNQRGIESLLRLEQVSLQYESKICFENWYLQEITTFQLHPLAMQPFFGTDVSTE